MPIEIITKQGDLEKQINIEVKKQLIAKIPKVLTKVELKIQNLILTAITQSEEYQSLLGGALREHFGLADPAQTLDTIAETIAAETKLEYTSDGELGTIRVELLPPNDQILFDIPGTSYISPPSGSEIPWLQWLLFEGSKKILVDYQINLARRTRKSSRTGSAIMVKPKLSVPEGWGVPIEYSGVENNNWLTRALDGIFPAIFDIIAIELEKL